MSHPSEEQPKVIGYCPCGAELKIIDDKLFPHKCYLEGYCDKFDLIKYTEEILGFTNHSVPKQDDHLERS